MKKSSILAVAALAAAALCGCSRAGEQAAVKEEADQIEAAHLAGREAARPFLNHELKDSLAIHEALVRAGAQRTKYDSLPQCRAAYDSAFISTVRTVDKHLAAEIQRQQHR